MSELWGFCVRSTNTRRMASVRVWRGNVLLYEAHIPPQESLLVDWGLSYGPVIGRTRIERRGCEVHRHGQGADNRVHLGEAMG